MPTNITGRTSPGRWTRRRNIGKTTDSREKLADRGLSFSCCKNSETTYFLKCDFAQKYVLFPFEMGKGEVWHF